MIKTLGYDCQLYDGLFELQQNDAQLATELLDEYEHDEWVDNQLAVYSSMSDFAYYELTEGWYIDMKFNDEPLYHGAPNPLNFIDLDALGKRLYQTGDSRIMHLTEDNRIVTTNIGW